MSFIFRPFLFFLPFTYLSYLSSFSPFLFCLLSFTSFFFPLFFAICSSVLPFFLVYIISFLSSLDPLVIPSLQHSFPSSLLFFPFLIPSFCHCCLSAHLKPSDLFCFLLFLPLLSFLPTCSYLFFSASLHFPTPYKQLWIHSKLQYFIFNLNNCESLNRSHPALHWCLISQSGEGMFWRWNGFFFMTAPVFNCSQLLGAWAAVLLDYSVCQPGLTSCCEDQCRSGCSTCCKLMEDVYDYNWTDVLIFMLWAS